MQRRRPRDQPPDERQQESGHGIGPTGGVGEREIHEEFIEKQIPGFPHLGGGRDFGHLGHHQVVVEDEDQLILRVIARGGEQSARSGQRRGP